MAAGDAAIFDGEIDALNESLKQLNEQGGRNSRNDAVCFDKTIRHNNPRKRKRSVDVETQTPKKRSKQPGCSSKIKDDEVKEVTDGLIQHLDSKLERLLEEKAMKNNLSVTNVKSILKNIICSPEVTDIFLNSLSEGRLSYEPKLTRAKAKQLLETPGKPLTKKIVSETQILMEGDLPEDSSDDEYRPNFDEEDAHSDDESFVSSHASDIGSPAHSQQDSEVFKRPLPVHGSGAEEELIVNRTRSKLPLTNTPLEMLELAFVPPDITTDMYDFDCDDDGWKNFLVELQYPQPSHPQDDEEADPDFNFLEDEEELDREELRVDRAVRISQKEVKSLLAELFEDEDLELSSDNETQMQGPEPIMEQSNPILTVFEEEITQEPPTPAEITQMALVAQPKKPTGVVYPIQVQPETIKLTVSFPTLDVSPITIEGQLEKPCEGPIYTSEELLPPQARLILEDQLRKHVQLLTQVHMITAQQSELSRATTECRDMLLDLDRNASHLHVANLNEALDLTQKWETYLQQNPVEEPRHLKYQRKYTVKPTGKVYDRRNSTPSSMQFHPQMVEMMSCSKIFLYPRLLPQLALFDTEGAPCRPSVHEEQLIAMGLEQFRPFVESLLAKKGKEATHMACCMMISHYMLPQWTFKQIYRRLKRLRAEKRDNPVKFVLQNGVAPPAETKIWPFNPNKMALLKDRDPQALPWRWRNAIHGAPVKRGRPPRVQRHPVKAPAEALPPVPLPRRRTVYNLRPAVRFRLADSPDDGLSSSGEEELDEEELRRTVLGEAELRSATVQEKKELRTTGLGRGSQRTQSEKAASQKQTRAKVAPARKTSSKRGRPPKKPPKKGAEEITCDRPIETSVDEAPPPAPTPAVPDIVVNPPLPSGGVKRYVLLSQISTVSSEVLHVWGPPGAGLRAASDPQTGGGGGGDTQRSNPGVREEGGGASSQGGQDLTGEGGGASMEGGGAGGGDENEDGERRRDLNDRTTAAVDEEQEEEESDNQGTGAGPGTSGLIAKARSPTHRHIRNQRLAKRVLQSWLADEGQNANSDFGYAQAYFLKVRQVLNPTGLESFCRLLSELEQNPQAAAQVYEQIKELLTDHVELAEEFVIFFTAEQAALCGKQFLHFLLVRLRDFFTRVKIYLKDSPQQLKRITKTLQNLTDACDPSIQDIKTAILPLLKGNAFLTNQFLQLFPQDVTFDSLVSDFEETRLDSAPTDDFEHISLTRNRDPTSKARKSSAKSQITKGKNKGKSWKK